MEERSFIFLCDLRTVVFHKWFSSQKMGDINQSFRFSGERRRRRSEKDRKVEESAAFFPNKITLYGKEETLFSHGAKQFPFSLFNISTKISNSGMHQCIKPQEPFIRIESNKGIGSQPMPIMIQWGRSIGHE